MEDGEDVAGVEEVEGRLGAELEPDLHAEDGGKGEREPAAERGVVRPGREAGGDGELVPGPEALGDGEGDDEDGLHPSVERGEGGEAVGAAVARLGVVHAAVEDPLHRPALPNVGAPGGEGRVDDGRRDDRHRP